MQQISEDFSSRLNAIMKEKNENQAKLSDAIGVSRQAISLYTKGLRNPDIYILKKISEHYNVSADWLLGLTNVCSIKEDVQAVCDYTGLYEEVVSKLHALKTDSDEDLLLTISRLDTINRIINNDSLFDSLDYIDSVFESVKSNEFCCNLIYNQMSQIINGKWKIYFKIEFFKLINSKFLAEARPFIPDNIIRILDKSSSFCVEGLNSVPITYDDEKDFINFFNNDYKKVYDEFIEYKSFRFDTIINRIKENIMIGEKKELDSLIKSMIHITNNMSLDRWSNNKDEKDGFKEYVLDLLNSAK